MRPHIVLAGLMISSIALAAPKKEIREAFDEMTEQLSRFDSGAFTWIANDAVMITNVTDWFGNERAVEGSGAQWKEKADDIMMVAQRQGDFSAYKDVRIKPHEGGYQLTAVRKHNGKCYEDPSYSLYWEKNDIGAWRIKKMYMTSQAWSSCPDAPSKAAQLSRSISLLVSPSLPLQLDAAGSTLTSITAEGETLTYLITMTQDQVEGMDMDKFAEGITAVSTDSICREEASRQVLLEGGMVVHIYQDANGKMLQQVRVTNQDCREAAGRIPEPVIQVDEVPEVEGPEVERSDD